MVENKLLKYENHKELKDLVHSTAYLYWKRSYKLCLYVFGSIEDTIQTGWVRLAESAKAQEIIKKGVKGNKGLLTTIIKRGMIDYSRSVLGRRDQDSAKGLKLYKTTYYMDYYTNTKDDTIPGDDMLDILFPKENNCPTIEDLLIQKELQSEIDQFIRNKLTGQHKQVMLSKYEDGMTSREISLYMNITESRVSQIHKKALKQLKGFYAKE